MAGKSGRTAIVKEVKEITPNMRRIVLGGPDLADFPEDALGGYIKFIFPNAPRSNPDRPVMRTYSVRAHDTAAGTVAVDFAMHADTGGIAMDWAVGAAVGDEIAVAGPGTIKMAPAEADWYLIAADMTGLPAASCNLERLPPEARGHAVFEIASDADAQELPVPPGMTVIWVVNSDPAQNKTALLDAVQSLDWLPGTPFVWTACEFDTMRALRSYYRLERGLAKAELYLSSYWRAGRTEDQHKVDKRKDADASTPGLAGAARSTVNAVRGLVSR
ncbi:MAG: siderophore-interacting protein [Pseudomonadota bacterium]